MPRLPGGARPEYAGLVVEEVPLVRAEDEEGRTLSADVMVVVGDDLELEEDGGEKVVELDKDNNDVGNVGTVSDAATLVELEVVVV